MRLKFLVVLGAFVFSAPLVAQVQAAATGQRSNLGIGGGLDYWRGDWGQIARYGPSVWISDELWHGFGINAEGHSMLAGGDKAAAQYKYVVGEGGLMYTYHRWRRFAPYGKGELGFASLDFPHKPTSHYTHDTRNTWAVGGGFEYKLWSRVWARADYTYDGFPNFLSPITEKHPTLDPAGFTLGATYHF